MKTTIDIIKIASTGVNVVLDASTKTTTDIIRIVQEVCEHNGHITIVNCDHKTTFDLLRIAKICPTHITLNLG